VETQYVCAHGAGHAARGGRAHFEQAAPGQVGAAPNHSVSQCHRNSNYISIDGIQAQILQHVWRSDLDPPLKMGCASSLPSFFCLVRSSSRGSRRYHRRRLSEVRTPTDSARSGRPARLLPEFCFAPLASFLGSIDLCVCEVSPSLRSMSTPVLHWLLFLFGDGLLVLARPFHRILGANDEETLG
jgi:hypothetical protein